MCNYKKFVYYHCSRQINHDCKELFVRVAVIEQERMKMCDELITELAELEQGLRSAIEKFTVMMKATHTGYGKKNLIAGYVKYVLQEGSEFEKTRLVRNLKVALELHRKRLIKT
jgi:hypothetical protein